MTRMIIAAVVLAACGGSKPKPAPGAPAPHPEAKEEHAGDLPPELVKFHDVLAPHWHAEAGAKRMQDTCAALADFQAAATAVAKSTPPTGTNADTWTAGTKELNAAVDGLGRPCAKMDIAGFDDAFRRVHESFHGLLAASGAHEGMGEHEEHEEHE